MDYRGKVALITGGSSGIGLAAARKLAGQGANVWILGRNQARLEQALAQVVAQKISEEQKFGCLAADVTRPDEVDQAIRCLVETAGTPDLVMNSAGRGIPGFIEDQDVEVFRDMMDVNYFGTIYVTKAVIPGMIQRGSGTIVNISSGAGYIGIYGFGAYSASKHAVRGFTDVLRVEMKPKGIQVSIVFPTATDTPGLVLENQVKPPDVMAFEGTVKTMSSDAVAEDILRDVARGRYLILPGFEIKLWYTLIRIAGAFIYPIFDWMIASARKKTGSSPQR